MRMWMVDPCLLCRQHLLGEHVEIHMLVSHLRRGRRIDGFLEKGLLEPGLMVSRHEELVEEMRDRGYRHSSPFEGPHPWLWPGRYVDPARSLADLRARCGECARRQDEEAAA